MYISIKNRESVRKKREGGYRERMMREKSIHFKISFLEKNLKKLVL